MPRLQRQTAVTAYLKSKQLLLFVFARQHTPDRSSGLGLPNKGTSRLFISLYRIHVHLLVTITVWGFSLQMLIASFAVPFACFVR